MNPISRLALKRPVATLMLVGTLILLGLLAGFRIPVTLVTGVVHPGLTVQVDQSGVTPDKIEETFARPIEDAVSTVGAIREIFSTSEEGRVKVNILFDQRSDIKSKALEIRERVDIAAAKFPREAQKPIILKYDPDQRPVMIVALNSQLRDQSDLREVADREILKKMQGIPGVSEVFLAGGREREILIDCDRQRLQAHGLAMSDLLRQLSRANVNQNLGIIQETGREYALQLVGRFQSVWEIRNVVIQADASGKTIRISDVGNVKMTFRDQETASRVNGNERITLYVYRAASANLLDISHDVRAELDAITARDVSFEILHDQATQVRSLLIKSFLLFVVGVLVYFVAIWKITGSMWQAAANGLIIPIQTTIALFPIYLLGYQISLITLGALLLSPIVTVFYSGSFISKRSGSRPGFLSALLLLGVLSPLVFGSPEYRDLYTSILVIVAFNLLIGIFLLLSLLPLVRRWPLKVVPFPRVFNPLVAIRLARRRARRNAWFSRVQSWGKRAGSFNWSLIVRWLRSVISQLKTLAGHVPSWMYAVLFFVLGAFCLSRLPASLNAPGEGGDVIVRVEFPSGSSFKVTNETTQKLEKLLIQNPKIVQITSKVESAQGTIFLKLAPRTEATDQLLDQLKTSLGDTDPAFVYMSAAADADVSHEVTVDVLGEELQLLDTIAKNLAKKVEGMEGASNVVMRYKAPRPEIRVTVDKGKSERVGISSREVGEVLRSAIQGGIPTRLAETNREVDIRIRFNLAYRKSAEDLNEIYLRSFDQAFVPLKEIASIKEEQVPVKVYRKNKKRVLSFSFRPKSNDFDYINGIFAQLANVEMPENYRIEFSREFREALEARRQLYVLLLLSCLAVYMILAGALESFREPLSRLFTLATVCCAAFVGLWVTGNSLNMMALIAIAISGCLTMGLRLRETQGTILAALYVAPLLFFPGDGRSWFLPAAIATLAGFAGSFWLESELKKALLPLALNVKRISGEVLVRLNERARTEWMKRRPGSLPPSTSDQS